MESETPPLCLTSTGGERGILEMFFCVYGTIISHSPFTEELLPCAA